VPFLDGRRVVTFDFLGWGRSDKPKGYPYTAANQTGEVGTVMDALNLDQAVLVAHDASGPPAIDRAFANSTRVAGLVLLNTYYGWHPALRAPEAIQLYSTPLLRNLARAVVRRNERLDEQLYRWQVGRFVRDPDVRAEIVPRLYADFRAARPAFWRLNDDLLPTVFTRRLRCRSPARVANRGPLDRRRRRGRGMASGIVVAATSYATLALFGGLVAAVVVPIIAATSLEHRPT
jgi:haloalkane dehalogenase